METISSSELKSILHSKRANIYLLEHSRILLNGGRVEYVTDEGRRSLYWNIPIANTTSLLLGEGTSITQGAMRELAKAGVLVGFCGGGGSPLYAANEVEVSVSWLTSQSEYRPTEYLQRWVSFWFDEEKRLDAAKYFQLVRFNQIQSCWLAEKKGSEESFTFNEKELGALIHRFHKDVEDSTDHTKLMLVEARFTKALYKLASNTVSYGDFTRSHRGGGTDSANRFLDYGNYLAYGLGATATWVLGLPHGLAVMHGKTRRGGLVFDVADMIKDALILPQAFIAAMAGESVSEFKQRCITNFNKYNALDVMIDTLKETSEELAL